MRLIDADALISVLEDMRERHRKNLFFASANAYDGAARIVKAMKTIEARPVVRGEWIPMIDEPTPLRNSAILTGYRCSICGRCEDKEEPFCNCGADMRPKEESEDAGN